MFKNNFNGTFFGHSLNNLKKVSFETTNCYRIHFKKLSLYF